MPPGHPREYAMSTDTKKPILKISLAPPVEKTKPPIMAALRDPSATYLTLGPNNTPRLGLKIPGHSDIFLDAEDLRAIHSRVVTPTLEGASPGAVFARTFSEAPDTSFSACFSDEKRARTLEIDGSERGEFADFIADKLAGFVSGAYQGMIDASIEEQKKAETEAAAQKAATRKAAQGK